MTRRMPCAIAVITKKWGSDIECLSLKKQDFLPIMGKVLFAANSRITNRIKCIFPFRGWLSGCDQKHESIYSIFRQSQFKYPGHQWDIRRSKYCAGSRHRDLLFVSRDMYSNENSHCAQTKLKQRKIRPVTLAGIFVSKVQKTFHGALLSLSPSAYEVRRKINTIPVRLSCKALHLPLLCCHYTGKLYHRQSGISFLYCSKSITICISDDCTRYYQIYSLILSTEDRWPSWRKIDINGKKTAGSSSDFWQHTHLNVLYTQMSV